MLELGRIIASLGAVVASTGLILYGVLVSIVSPDDYSTTATVWMMILGVVATVIGVLMYRSAYQEED